MQAFTDLENYFNKAKAHIIAAGHGHEIEYVRAKTFDQLDAADFVIEFAFVVISSGMKNQVAEKIFEKFCKQGAKAVGHPGKRAAIVKITKGRKEYFAKIKAADNKIEILSELPWIGEITKYHLARNMGLDCVKPDRHMVRLAETWKFKDPAVMCNYLATVNNERIGVIDVILWRYCNLAGDYGRPNIV
jgi:hypothetical protein